MTSPSKICPSTGYGPLSNRSEQKTRIQLLGQLGGCLQDQRPEAASYRLKQEQVGGQSAAQGPERNLGATQRFQISS